MQHGYLEEDRYAIMEVSNPINGHGRLTDYVSNMMPLWYDGYCSACQKVLIDNDYLSDSDESDDAYEEDFAINETKKSSHFIQDK